VRQSKEIRMLLKILEHGDAPTRCSTEERQLASNLHDGKLHA
jgi:hypothetical protein